MGLYVFYDNLQVLRVVAEQCESARLHRHVAKRYAYASHAILITSSTLMDRLQSIFVTFFYLPTLIYGGWKNDKIS